MTRIVVMRAKPLLGLLGDELLIFIFMMLEE